MSYRRATLVLMLFCAAAPAAQNKPHPDAVWRDALERAGREKKPILVFFRPAICEKRCDDFERLSLPHPTIQRRLPAVVFVTLPTSSETAARSWNSADAGVGLFDRSGVVRARWHVVPDTMWFGMMLDSAKAVSTHFDRAVQLIEEGERDEAELVIADALTIIGRSAEARTALRRASQSTNADVRRKAAVAAALLDAREGRTADAIAQLDRIVAVSETDDAGRAAAEALSALRHAGEAPNVQAIRILPLMRQVVTGRHVVRTNVNSTSVSRVVFFLDGRESTRADRPPFTANIDFGRTPERHVLRAVAFDRRGREVARDERVVNDAGDAFRLRLVEPREGPVGGSVRVVLAIRVPPARRIARVVISWSDAERAVLRSAPWEAVISIPSGQVGVLRSVAELDDGRISEDAVLLNAGGAVEHSDVQLVELPITILRNDGPAARLEPKDFIVREGSRTRPVESLAAAEETPLTIGLLIDTSDSMQKTLPDVQEAAVRFLDSVLSQRDSAFLVRFDTRATLLQPPTSDRERLTRRITALQPRGLTALYDATALGLLQFEGVKGRRAMVLLTDGLDRTSEYTAVDVAELAKRTNVPIHVIASIPGVPAGITTDPRNSESGQIDPNLRLLAQSTGGTFHTLRSLSDLPAVYSRIETALRAQVLAFIRTDRAARESEWRTIRIETRWADAEVYAPAGYYAPW